MAEHSSIEWTDATWQPITGCSVVSPGCTNCYAMKLAGTRLRHHPSRKGLTVDSKSGPVWNGAVRFNEQWLTQPLDWKSPRRIFVCAHGDLFHEGVPDEWIDRVFAVMALAPQHTFQVLTKRADRMRQWFAGRRSDSVGLAMLTIVDRIPHGHRCLPWPLSNVWLGVSAEDQRRADERIPHLLSTPAAVRFVSAEPLLGSIDLTKISGTACLAHAGGCCGDRPWVDALRGIQGCSRAGAYAFPLRGQMPRGIDWVIVGGESGNSARPMHPDWARALRDQCAGTGVNYFFKQWGSWQVALDRDRDDPDWRADYSRELADGGKHKWLNLGGGCGFHGERFHVMRNVGKAAAGRLLDGVEYNGMPETRP